jgi:ankyrin repeat protein
VKQTDSYDFTPFLQAAKHGYIAIMSWLLTEGGLSLAEKTDPGSTA